MVELLFVCRNDGRVTRCFTKRLIDAFEFTDIVLVERIQKDRHVGVSRTEADNAASKNC